MKKGLLIGLACLLFLTGCGDKESAKDNNAKKESSKTKEKASAGNYVTCTGKLDDAGVTATLEIKAKISADVVKDASVSMIFEDEKTAKQYCSIFELANTLAEDDADKVDFSCSGKKLTFNSYADFASAEDDDEDIIGLTKADFIKEMESSEGVTCK